MMTLKMNGEPHIYRNTCGHSETGTMMSEAEKHDFLVSILLETYSICSMKASKIERPELSFLDKLRGKSVPAYYPDIEINDFHGTEGKKAYYIVAPKGARVTLNATDLPKEMQNAFIKVIYCSVFNLTSGRPEYYSKGSDYAAQFKSEAILPRQTNEPLPRMLSDQELAQVYAEATRKLDASILKPFLDKDFHYNNASMFDDMASRDEFIDYIEGKFATLRRFQSIKRVELGRNGETGEWSVLIKQLQDDGEYFVGGFMIKSANGRITSVDLFEMDLPNF